MNFRVTSYRGKERDQEVELLGVGWGTEGLTILVMDTTTLEYRNFFWDLVVVDGRDAVRQELRRRVQWPAFRSRASAFRSFNGGDPLLRFRHTD